MSPPKHGGLRCFASCDRKFGCSSSSSRGGLTLDQGLAGRSDRPRLRVFVSSPGDVAEERLIAKRILDRLADEFAPVAKIESIFWEHEPLLASETFQTQIVRPSETDIVVCILWSRLGTRLPRQFTHADGTPYNSGTEFEFDDALEGRRQHGMPDLLVYRKTAEPLVSLKDTQAAQSGASAARVARRVHAAVLPRRGWHADRRLPPFRERGRLRDPAGRPPSQADPDAAARSSGSASTTGRMRCGRRGPRAVPSAACKPSSSSTTPSSSAAPGRSAKPWNGSSGRRPTAARFCWSWASAVAGKSSLVRAGVLPMLVQPGVVEGVGLWRRAILRPSERSGDLFDGLATALLREDALPELASDGTTVRATGGHVASDARGGLALVKGALSQAAGNLCKAETSPVQPVARLVLVLDQLEELFTAGDLSAEHRAGLLPRDPLPGRKRPDVGHRHAAERFLSPLSRDPRAGGIEGGPRANTTWQPPDPAEIAQLVRRPAFAAGLRFEEDLQTGDRLDDLLRDAAAAQPRLAAAAGIHARRALPASFGQRADACGLPRAGRHRRGAGPACRRGLRGFAGGGAGRAAARLPPIGDGGRGRSARRRSANRRRWPCSTPAGASQRYFRASRLAARRPPGGWSRPSSPRGC